MNDSAFHRIGKAFVELYGNDGENCYKDGVCLWCGDSPTRYVETRAGKQEKSWWVGKLHIDECWVGQFEKIVDALDKPPHV